MWDDKRDLDLWEKIAREAHSRHSRKTGAYVRSLTAVEDYGHKFVAERARGAKRVLEIGVGGGEHLVYRQPTTGSQEYIGVDLSPDYARICRDKFSIDVHVADIAKLPFEAGRFDCVIAMAILEHVQNLSQALAEVERVLVVDGKFLVLIPTNGSLAVSGFKRLMTYPAMRRQGIARPDLVWHHLNVNSFKRVQAELMRRFDVEHQQALPSARLPWWLSPLWTFVCRRKRSTGGGAA